MTNEVKSFDISNESYPMLLKNTPNPPERLYAAGEVKVLDEEMPFVAIIGSRRCSEYGLTVAHKLSKDLAACGIIIVSGMARGIDSSAHQGALDAGGLTIADLCGGVDD